MCDMFWRWTLGRSVPNMYVIARHTVGARLGRPTLPGGARTTAADLVASVHGLLISSRIALLGKWESLIAVALSGLVCLCVAAHACSLLFPSPPSRSSHHLFLLLLFPSTQQNKNHTLAIPGCWPPLFFYCRTKAVPLSNQSIDALAATPATPAPTTTTQQTGTEPDIPYTQRQCVTTESGQLTYY